MTVRLLSVPATRTQWRKSAGNDTPIDRAVIAAARARGPAQGCTDSPSAPGRSACCTRQL